MSSCAERRKSVRRTSADVLKNASGLRRILDALGKHVNLFQKCRNNYARVKTVTYFVLL
jgi:hypothetical protein